MNQAEHLTVQTTRFGEIQVERDTVLAFPLGLLGMEQLHRFVLIEGSGPFQWLQSIDDPDATFVVIDHEQIVSDYDITPREEDLQLVSVDGDIDALTALLIVTVPRQGEGEITTNLQAPLLVNIRTCTGVQAVLPERYPVRHPIVRSQVQASTVVPAA